jgi:protein-S-isoprenylcysteine O-methyltransferase Ste14
MLLLRTVLFTVLVPGFVTGALPYFTVSRWPSLLHLELGHWRWLGLLPLSVGAILYVICAWDFTFTGRGTPAVYDPPKKLVTVGLYRWVRNPMYIGIILALLGQGLLYQSMLIVGLAAGFWLVVHIFITLYEEPHLSRKFGESYRKFLRTVPRWLPRKPHDDRQ